MMEDIYQPREDSFLLQKYVEEFVSGRVLDMGTGSGIQAISAALKSDVNMVVAIDINPMALEYAERYARDSGILEKITFVCSDLFKRVEGKFDWILFNAPYLPSEGLVDEDSWVGGCTGGELVRRFLSDAFNYLSPSGAILMVYSSYSGLEEQDFKQFCFELLEEKSLFFEKIYCVKLIPF